MTAAQPRRYRRSRLILLVWSDEWPVLVQADTLREFRVDARLFELLSQLGEWRTAEEISGAGMSLGEDDLAGLCDLGILESYGDAAASGEPWEPLELAVHRRTARVGVPLEGRAAPPRSERDVR